MQTLYDLFDNQDYKFNTGQELPLSEESYNEYITYRKAATDKGYILEDCGKFNNKLLNRVGKFLDCWMEFNGVRPIDAGFTCDNPIDRAWLWLKLSKSITIYTFKDYYDEIMGADCNLPCSQEVILTTVAEMNLTDSSQFSIVFKMDDGDLVVFVMDVPAMKRLLVKNNNSVSTRKWANMYNEANAVSFYKIRKYYKMNGRPLSNIMNDIELKKMAFSNLLILCDAYNLSPLQLTSIHQL